jgi:hypothetical protein
MVGTVSLHIDLAMTHFPEIVTVLSPFSGTPKVKIFQNSDIAVPLDPTIVAQCIEFQQLSKNLIASKASITIPASTPLTPLV